MKQAYVSGQAGAAFLRGTPPLMWSLEAETPVRATDAFIAHTLAQISDLAVVSYRTDAELLGRLRQDWQADRALRLFILCLEDGDHDRIWEECFEGLEVLLEKAGADVRIRKEFLSRPLPEELDSRGFPPGTRAEHLWRQITETQPAIKLAFSILDALPQDAFPDSDGQLVNAGPASALDPRASDAPTRNRMLALEQLARLGVVQLLVEGLRDLRSPDAMLFELTKAATPMVGGRGIVLAIGAALRKLGGKRDKLEVEFESEFEEDENFDAPRIASREAYQNTRNQQAGIIARLREGNLSLAVSYAADLVAKQSHNSSPTQIAKTLCLLSQEAKRYGFLELQLQWARQATETAPDDAHSYGQVADALIGLGDFPQASIALDKAEAAGAGRYAEIGRARMLRAQGAFEEALKHTEKAITQSDEADSHVAWSLKAEILQDMGHIDEALEVYRSSVRTIPNSPVLHCGLATVLMEQGQFEEADHNFILALACSTSLQHKAVALNGRATLRKKFGQLDAAIAMYDEAISKVNDDSVARCGKADVLKLQGKLPQAVQLYTETIHKFPGHFVAYSGKADVLLELAKFAEADRAFQIGAAKFPHTPDFTIGSARAKAAMGEYASAHRLFEEALLKFPRSLEAQFGIANCLKRMRRFDEACERYSILHKIAAVRTRASLGLGSVLIAQGRYDDAIQVLPTNYRTELEWSGFFLKGLAYLHQIGPIAALEHFAQVGTVPFARVRSLTRSLIARIRLEQGRPKQALEAADRNAHGSGKVIYLHALAANSRIKEAQAVLRSIRNTQGPREQLDLAKDVAAVFSIGSYRRRRSLKAILEQEQLALTMDAAA